MMKSKFSFWVMLITFVIFILSGLNYLIFTTLILFDKNDTTAGILAFIALLLFTWVWLIFGELRTKIITVQIDYNIITVTNFGGLGRKKEFAYKEFEGYRTALLPSKGRTYEYLYLMKDGKKKIKISQFYHRNYSQLKKEITKKVKFLGQERFSYLREFKEIFE
jgi:hypothetical protein